MQGHRMAPRSQALHICLYLTQRRSKAGDLSVGKREKLRPRVGTQSTISPGCFVEELRFKRSQKHLRTTLCSRDAQGAAFCWRSNARRDAAQPVLPPYHRQSSKISAPGYQHLFLGLEMLPETGFSAHCQISFCLSSRSEPSGKQRSTSFLHTPAHSPGLPHSLVG